MKIWSRTVVGDKITRDYLHDCQSVDNDNIEQLLQDICQAMDISTPIINSTKRSHLISFNHARFFEGDYIDYIDYDYFEVELVYDKHK